MIGATAICTWFVADDPDVATFLPQIGARSDSLHSQAHYWRCVICFFATSLASNPHTRHILFTNVTPPLIDNVHVGEKLMAWGVDVVTLPITYRLPPNSVTQWGNQFYILDIMGWLAGQACLRRAIVLDCDCIWLGRADAIECGIEAEGALAYTIDGARDEPVNGRTRADLARFVRRTGGTAADFVPYNGGEFYAATQQTTSILAADARRLWPDVVAQHDDSPREEAHFLSALHALRNLRSHTANPFIRRMWTTLRHNNLQPTDRNLLIWHLPAEKRSGFKELFSKITNCSGTDPRRDSAVMGLNFPSYARSMGFPSRRPSKLVRDVALKVREKTKL